MSVMVWVETETWWVRKPDPTDKWDAGRQDGRVVDVRAGISSDPAEEYPTLYGRGGLAGTYDCDAMEGDTVFVVVADFTSGSTFGTTAGYYQILSVTKDFEDAMGLARAAEAVRGSQFEFEYNDVQYYVGWTGYFESLKEVRVWDCFLRPRLD